MAKRQTDDMRRWAIKGAETRLAELAEEAAGIHRAFPELRLRGGGGRPPATPNEVPDGRTGQLGRRRRRKMSAEARKRISEAQKARWARQKRKA